MNEDEKFFAQRRAARAQSQQPVDDLGLHLYQASQRDPNTAAAAIQASKDRELPLDTAINNLPELRRQQMLRSIDPEKLRRENPKLSAFLNDSKNAAVSIDDTENLSFFERAGRDVWDSITGAVVPLVESLPHAGRALGASVTFDAPAGAAAMLSGVVSKVQQNLPQLAGQSMEKKPFDVNNVLKPVTAENNQRDVLGNTLPQLGGDQNTDILDLGDANRKLMPDLAGQRLLNFANILSDVSDVYRDDPKNMSYGEQMFTAAVRSIGQNFVPLMASMATGNPAFAILGGGVMQGGQSYQQAVNEGMDKGKALNFSLQQGTFESLGELVPEYKFFKALKAGAPLTKTVINNVIGSVPSEIATQLSQSYNEFLQLPSNKDKSLDEWMATVPKTILDTAVIAAIQSGMQSTAIGTIAKVQDRLSQEAHSRSTNVLRSTLEQTQFDQQIAAVESSEMRKRAPEQFQTLNQSVNGDRVVYVAPAAVAALTEQGIAVSPEMIKQMNGSGADIEISRADVLANPEMAAALRDHIKFRPDGLTVPEIKDQHTEVDDMIARAQREVSERSGLDAIQNSIADQIVATGRQQRDTAMKSAAIITARAATAAQDYGLTPEEVVQRMGFTVQGPASPALTGEMMDQNTPEFQQWFGKSQVVDEGGKPLVVYHGTDSDIPSFDVGYDDANYFTPDKNIASHYAEEHSRSDEPAPNVVPVYLSVKNPLVLDEAALSKRIGSGENRDWTAMQNVVAAAKAAGHDGIHLKGVMDFSGSNADGVRQESRQDQWLTFEPEQIKSAIGNNGNYDPNDPNILNQNDATIDGTVSNAQESNNGNATNTAQQGGLQEPSGLRGSNGVLSQSDRPVAGAGGREEDGSLAGLPRKVGEYTASVHAPAVTVAKEYMAKAGIPYNPVHRYVRVNPEQATKIADEYEKLKHDPNDPYVKASYAVMIEETIAQYQAILDAGVTVEFITGKDPYAGNPREMIKDVRENNHMWVFSTRDGYGSDVEFDATENPMLAMTNYEISGQPAMVNDLFRVVHDYFGHVKEGVGFRADGEENAWRAHSAMYSSVARDAMTTETRGQNSWVNYGPYGEQNRSATPDNTVYAKQKIGILPKWVVEQGRTDPAPQAPAVPKPKEKAQRGEHGLYSAVEQTVLDLNLPGWKKENGTMPGLEVWNKLSKSPGIKKEELAALDLKDYLTAGTKFTRQDVLDYVRGNGINLQIITADNSESADSEFHWNESVDDDSSNWQHEINDQLYSFDKGHYEDVYALGDADRWMKDWVENNLDSLKDAYADDEAVMSVLNSDDINLKHLIEAIGEDQLRTEMREDVEREVEQHAEASYMDNPIHTYYDSNTEITVTGNDDYGYRIMDRNGRAINRREVYSFGEAEIQAREYAYDNGLWLSEDSPNVAKWGEYVTEGKHTNYRELKLTLPDQQPAFNYDTHFPDDNIVAFLRVTDRVKELPGNPAAREGQSAPDDFKMGSTTLGKYRERRAEVASPDFNGHVGGSFANTEELLAALDRHIAAGETMWKHAGTKAKTFFIDEFQSDWDQQGRQKGYSKAPTAEEKYELNQRSNDALQTYTESFSELFPVELSDEVRSYMGAGPSEIVIPRYVESILSGGGVSQEQQQHFTQTLRSTKQGEDLFQLWKTWKNAEEEARQAYEGVPDFAYKKDAWLSLGLKIAINKAISEGHEALAWADSEVLANRWSERYKELYSNQYDTKMPSIVEKLTGVKPVHLQLNGEPYPTNIVTSEQIQQARDDLRAKEDALYAQLEAMPGYPGIATPTEQASWIQAQPEAASIYEQAQELRVQHAQMKSDKADEAPEGMWIIPLTKEMKDQIGNESYTLFQEGRAAIQLNGFSDRVIRLGAKSDLSSFLHEGAHLFLDFEAQLAAEFGITPQQQKILDWLGVSSFDEITRDDHEKWAETFEAYLREGKAPSVGLREAFASFARWLTRIYEFLTKLPNQKLDNEVRAIFDRLLATQEEIDRNASQPQYDQLFRSREQSGMTDAQWKAYTEQRQRALDRATRTIDDKMLEQYRRQRTAEWKAEREPIYESILEELMQEPIYQVMDETKAFPMDHAAVLEALGVSKLPGKLIGRTKKDGVDPQEYAEVHGFAGVTDMLNKMLAAPTAKQEAAARAEAEMVRRHGDVLNDGTLEAEVEEAMHNEEWAKLLEMEIATLRPRKAPPIDRELLKAKAKELITSLKYSQIKPDKYYRQEIRAAREAGSTTDRTKLAELKLQQLVNHYLYKQAVETRAAMEKQRQYVKRVQTRAYDTKQVAPDYVTNMKVLSNLYDMTEKGQQQSAIEGIISWYTTQLNDPNKFVNLAMLDENILAAIAYKETHGGRLDGFNPLPKFDDLTADKLQGVYDMLKHMRYVGGELSDLGRLQFNAEKAELAEGIVEHGKKDVSNPLDSPTPNSKVDKEIDKANHFRYRLNNLYTMTRLLDGNQDNGPANRFIYRALEDAQNHKRDLQWDLYDKYSEVMNGVNNVAFTGKDVTITKENGGTWTTKNDEQRFMLALYWGTESSREAIRQGYQVTDADVMQMMSKLSPAQLKLVNAVWEVNESLWPETSKAATQMLGVAPPKLDPTTFVVNGVPMTGGHMRLYYDSVNDELKDMQQQGQDMMKTTPSRLGSTFERIGSGGKPPLLDRNNINRAYADAVHYIAFAVPARRLAGMLNGSDVKAAIQKKYGAGFYRALLETVEGVSGNRAAKEAYPWLSGIFRHLRKAVTFKNLAFSIVNTLQQTTSLPIVIQEVGKQNFLDATMQLVGDPTVKQTIDEKSSFMRHRGSLINRDSAEFLNNITIDGKAAQMWQKFVEAGFTPQKAIDAMFSYPTWLAKYQSSIADHGDEKRAIHDADTAVANAVGSGDNLHLGGMFQSNNSELQRTLTMFGSWFNAYYNRVARSSKNFTKEGLLSKDMLHTALTIPLLLSVVQAVMAFDVPAEPDRDKAGAWLRWMTKNYVGFMAGLGPILRDAFSVFGKGYAPRTVLTGSLESIQRASNAATSDKANAIKTTSAVTKAVTNFVPIPGAANVTHFLDYMDSYEQGKEGDTFNVLQALASGPDRNKPEKE